MRKEPLAGVDETTYELPHDPPGAAAVWWRRTGLGLIALVVVTAGLGLLGPRTAEMSDSGGGYELEVTYPRISRAGQPAPLHLEVESPSGFDGPVQLRICDEFFDNLDFQNWYPNPAAEAATAPYVVYEFDPPPVGERLEISLDARTSPGQFGGREVCEVSILASDAPVASVSFTAWRLP